MGPQPDPGRTIMRDPKMPYRVLVVEDEVLVGLDLMMQLEDAGFTCIGPAPTVASAMKLVATETPDFAVLDANLGGISPVAVAEDLRDRGVPFLYASGYDERYIRDNLPEAPLLQKPIQIPSLLAHINDRLAAV